MKITQNFYCPPMLASTYDPDCKKFNFWNDTWVQPKLDGVRCLVLMADQQVQAIHSRSLKPLYLGEELMRQLQLFASKYVIGGNFAWLDGELYIHKMKFQKIQGIVSKQNNSDPRKAELVFNVYDCYRPQLGKATFQERQDWLRNCWGITPKASRCHTTPHKELKNLSFVGSVRMFNSVGDSQQAWNQFCNPTAEELLQKYISLGYEGCMLRDGASVYENKRSAGLWKYKEWQDGEYKIIDVLEGKGKNLGCARFVLTTKSGETFKATAPGNYEEKRRFWVNRKDYINKLLTVKYQEATKAGVPRFPIALHIRQSL